MLDIKFLSSKKTLRGENKRTKHVQQNPFALPTIYHFIYKLRLTRCPPNPAGSTSSWWVLPSTSLSNLH